jgi:urease subunit gamma/beta
VHLTPTELDRLTIFSAAELARRRRAKGWQLTHPEALAIICDDMHEAARGGASYEGVVAAARSALTADDVLDGVAELIGTVKIECLFGDGMRVLHVERPIGAAPQQAPRAAAARAARARPAGKVTSAPGRARGGTPGRARGRARRRA